MKKLTIIALSLMVTASSVIAGGLVTNTNQSAAWARTLTREASLGVDAVYFNPAGLAQLKNGLHLSLSNQSIFQTRTITNNFAGLNNGPESLYEAELAAPLFPSVYAAFKMDKWTISGGFNIIGGGGTASFEEGIPSIEMNMLTLAPTVNAIMSQVDAGVEAATGVRHSRYSDQVTRKRKCSQRRKSDTRSFGSIKITRRRGESPRKNHERDVTFLGTEEGCLRKKKKQRKKCFVLHW